MEMQLVNKLIVSDEYWLNLLVYYYNYIQSLTSGNKKIAITDRI